jgi:hypothetical protein
VQHRVSARMPSESSGHASWCNIAEGDRPPRRRWRGARAGPPRERTSPPIRSARRSAASCCSRSSGGPFSPRISKPRPQSLGSCRPYPAARPAGRGNCHVWWPPPLVPVTAGDRSGQRGRTPRGRRRCPGSRGRASRENSALSIPSGSITASFVPGPEVRARALGDEFRGHLNPPVRVDALRSGRCEWGLPCQRGAHELWERRVAEGRASGPASSSSETWPRSTGHERGPRGDQLGDGRPLEGHGRVAIGATASAWSTRPPRCRSPNHELRGRCPCIQRATGNERSAPKAALDQPRGGPLREGPAA